jgi:PKD repeat protein
MIEKKDQHRWGWKERLIRRGCILIVLLGFAMIISTPVTAATTSIHIVKYANDGTSILDETTVDFHWMEANLPVYGDGITHYYHQGPVFNSSIANKWNPEENDPAILTKDYGAAKGTNTKDLCDLVGGMSSTDKNVTLLASDGFSKAFAYSSIYNPPARSGPIVLTWYRSDQGYVDGSYLTGIRNVMFADTSTNPWGTHVFGLWDMHETYPENFWYYYQPGQPSTTGLSVQNIDRIFIYSNQAPPPVAAFISDVQSGTAPLLVHFTDQSINTPTSWKWEYRVDAGSWTEFGSGARNPSRTFAAGIFDIRLTATNAGGSDSELKTDFITVNPAASAPVAAFYGNPLSGTALLTVSFTDTSTNTPTAWSWSFRNVAGNNTQVVFSTVKNPAHTFGVGNYSIVLDASNSAGHGISTQGTFINVTALIAPTASKIGVYRNGVWIIDTNDNFAWDGVPIDSVFTFGGTGNTSVYGDWDGNGKPEAGVYNNGIWYLDYNSNGIYDGPVIDRTASFGQAGYKPVVGNWDGTGKTKIGVEKDGIWAIDYNGNYLWDGAVTDRFAAFGSTGDIPVIGDWDGTGKDKIGSHKDGFWAIDYNGNYVWDGAVTDRFAGLGQTGDVPVIGDWNGDGKDKIGMEINGFWATDYNGNYVWDGAITDRFAGFGSTGDIPVVGDWDGTGKAKIGSFKDGFWAIDNNGNYVWDGAVTDRFAGFGQIGDVPVVSA